ncbi:DnaJ family domain-containing protein [Paenibacillus pedocola]|uniref:DnaJ family domain-containing protein n=1 Tax=Paenibacillus pedocola TaxID=3242193 RepID=UPI002877BEBD|nr:DnaJ family domain-containing protein [Paenibacillus typhae]
MANLSWLAEQRIQEAMRNGEFEDLPGHGKPLELEDLSGVPEDLRMSFKIMKNAGILPEEIILRSECVTLEGLLAACHSSGDPGEMKSLRTKLTAKRMRLQELLRERGLESSSVFIEYGEQVRQHLLNDEK